MLDQKTIEIIKSTVPVLEQYGETITKRFYQMMFTNHPELLNIFNHANQKHGRQQKALANSVYAAAKYIDNLEAILPVVNQIAHKHRSLGIKPEHYPIVGEHLLLAIKDVLQDAATEEIIDAWGKAYGVIADAFIGVEKQLYDHTEQKTGGWRYFRKFEVADKVKESEVITSFYLKPTDGGEIADFTPGQYISVKLNIEGREHTQIRQYSLSDSAGKGYYRISVKREDIMGDRPAGVVSTYLHDQVNIGDEIEVSAPAGDFILEDNDSNDIVLLSGGVGITPMMSMLNSRLDQKQAITFIHAAINGQMHAFDKDVREKAENNKSVSYYYSYEKPSEMDVAGESYHHEGFITKDWLDKVITNKNSVVYMCGPVPFMQAMYEALMSIGISKENIRYEFFGPSLQLKETTTVS